MFHILRYPLQKWGFLFGLLVITSFSLTSTPQIAQAVCDPEADYILASVTNDGAPSYGSDVQITPDGRYVVFYSSQPLGMDDFNGIDDIYRYDRLSCSIARASIRADGTEPNDVSYNPDISDDGRYIVFDSYASNLVANDTNDGWDIFRKDMQTGALTRINVSSSGDQADFYSFNPRISGNGRYVAFVSGAANLVANDTNDSYDVFVRDLQTNTTTRISVSSSGVEQESGSYINNNNPLLITPDGRFVAFTSDSRSLATGITNQCSSGAPCANVFIHDRQTATTTRINVSSAGLQANGHSEVLQMSDDGRYVIFQTMATNLAPPDPNGTDWDAMLRDRQTNQTTRISLKIDGTDYPVGLTAFRGDGQFVSLVTGFGAFVETYLADFITDEVAPLFPYASDTFIPRDFSLDGRWAAVEARNISANTMKIYLVKLRGTELVPNGDFASVQPSGIPTGWDTFGNVQVNTVGGVVQMEWNGLGSVLTRKVNTPHTVDTPMSVEFQMGNSSSIRKRVTVLLHASDFSDLFACTFWLTPNQPLRDYRIRTYNSIAWADTMVSFYPTIPGGGGSVLLDNISVNTDTYFARSDQVLCVDPNAPAPTTGADSANLLTNGNFAAGLNGWTAYTQPGESNFVHNNAADGTFQFYRSGNSGNPAPSLIQSISNTIPAFSQIELRFTLGNSSSTRMRVTPLLHAADFSDLSVCTFWIPPNTPAGTHVMRVYSTKVWNGASVSFYPASAFASDPGGRAVLDDVVLRTRPTLSLKGAECYEPETAPAGSAFGLDEPLSFPPTLIPTATGMPYSASGAPAEIPALSVPTVVPPTGNEGVISE